MLAGVVLAFKGRVIDYFVEYFFVAFLGLFSGFVIGVIIALTLPMKLYEQTKEVKLEALQDGSSGNGKFFLGRGQVDGKMQYVYYFQDGDLYKMNQVDYTVAAVKYLNDTTIEPTLTIFTKVPTDDLINKFALDLSIRNQRYVFNVPQGSIKTDYTLDAK